MEKIERFWDRMAKNQDKDIEMFREISDRIVESTLKYLNKSDNVLDVGCGTGEKTIEISVHVNHIHGFDISRKAIELAERRSIDGGVQNVTFTKTILDDDIFEKASFDVILAYNIVHALQDDNGAIGRMAELLKPGGYLIMNTPCLGEKMSKKIFLQFIPYRILSKLSIIPLKIKLYKFNELEDVLVNNEFEILEKEKMFQGMSSIFLVGKKRI